MRKVYLFLMMLFIQLITGGSVFAQTDAEYEAALAAIQDQDQYFITTEYDGVTYYLTWEGGLTEYQEDAKQFTFLKNSAGGFKQYGFRVYGNTYFSNPNSSSSIDDTSIHTNGDGRDTWEVQVFFLNEEGKFAVRSTNCTPAESGWSWVGTAFWAIHFDEELGYPTAGYDFEPQFIWELTTPPDKQVLYETLNSLYDAYQDWYWQDAEDLNMGTEFGQYTDYDSFNALRELLGQIEAYLDYFADEDFDPLSVPDFPTLEEAKELRAKADALYQAIIDSEVPFKLPADGYYRIFAYKRYKSTFDPSGYVDKAIAASFDKNHQNKGVYGTVRRDLANYVWKLEQHGDSIMIKNVGMGTYISKTSTAENRIIMTDNADDATHLMFDYAGLQYAEYADAEGNIQGEDKDVFAIRLAGEAKGGSYIHQQEHNSSAEEGPYDKGGHYETDSGQDIELQFWIRTYNRDNAQDNWTSEWYLEPVTEEEVEGLVDAFGPIVNHELLVQQNQELRDKVAETLALAKDIIRTKMINSAEQLDNRFGDPSEGTNLNNLLDNDPTTFWHTTWHGYADGVEPMWYNTGEIDEETGEPIELECHYLQISGMEGLVGDCELYLREREGADNDRVKTLVLMGTDNLKNEDDEWELMTDPITLPHTGKGEENTVSFHVDNAYPYVRVLVTETAYSSYAFRSFWHAAELQFYVLTENPNSQFNSMGDVAETLESTYNSNCATANEDITIEIYEALLKAYEAFLKAGIVDPAELRAALAKYDGTTKKVAEGNNPGQWKDKSIADAYDALYKEISDYNTAGKYTEAQVHKYAVMLKAMEKSVMEKANGVETDKWYRITVPTEEMYDMYEFSKDGVDQTSLREDQATVYGTIVTTAKEVSETDTEINDQGEEVETTVTHLEAIGGEDVRESDRLFFMGDDEIEDKDVSKFRFVEIESDAADYTALLKDVKENMGMALDMSSTFKRGEKLITSATQLSSNASDEAEGKDLGALIDGNPSTFWHSDWHKKVIAPPYLQVALNEPVSGLIQVDIVRRNNGFGHIVRMYVQGSTDGETWTNVGYLEAPCTGAASESVSCQPIDLGGEFSYLRFINTCRWLDGGGTSAEMDPFAEPASVDEYDKTWTYFHAAEFQIYPVTPEGELSASGKALQKAYVTANKIVLKDATAEDLAAAAQAYKAFQTEFNTEQGKAVLPNGLEKAPATYALQNKATGLFVFVDGTGNQNNIYLKTIPTLFNYSAIGYQRSLIGGKNLAGQSTNYLHVGETNRRFCTWSTTAPTTNSGLFIAEADEAYQAPAEFTYVKNVKPGRIIDWCNSVSITSVDAPSEAHAYTALGQYTVGEGEDAEIFLAVKAVETIPAGDPALYICGDTTSYDAEDDYVEPVKFKIAGNEKPVLEGNTVNGLIGTLVTKSLSKYLIYFNANYAAVQQEGQSLAVTPCSAVLDLDTCPAFDQNDAYDFSICLGQAGNEVADGVKDISTALEKISQRGNVYSMDGKLLMTGATLNSLKALGSGMYILNGVKVVVK